MHAALGGQHCIENKTQGLIPVTDPAKATVEQNVDRLCSLLCDIRPGVIFCDFKAKHDVIQHRLLYFPACNTPAYTPRITNGGAKRFLSFMQCSCCLTKIKSKKKQETWHTRRLEAAYSSPPCLYKPNLQMARKLTAAIPPEQ